MGNLNPGWYVLYTKAHHEKKIQTRLSEMNIESYFPSIKKLKTWSDRKKFVEEPLFSCYLFVFLNDMNSYFSTLQIAGCLYYLKNEKRPVRLDNAIISNIKLATNKLATDQIPFEISDRIFTPGERIVINQGILSGLCCEVIKYQNKRQLLVRIDPLNKNIIIGLPDKVLEVYNSSFCGIFSN